MAAWERRPGPSGGSRARAWRGGGTAGSAGGGGHRRDRQAAIHALRGAVHHLVPGHVEPLWAGAHADVLVRGTGRVRGLRSLRDLDGVAGSDRTGRVDREGPREDLVLVGVLPAAAAAIAPDDDRAPIGKEG